MESLISPFIGTSFLVVKITFIVFGLIFLVGTIWFLRKTSWLKMILFQDAVEFFTYRPFGVRRLEREWLKIMARFDTGLESEYKLAIIEADNILDDIFKKMGYGGETLGDRLKALTSSALPNIEDVKKAHQVRNNVVHDPDYRLSLDAARKAISAYQKALEELQAL